MPDDDTIFMSKGTDKLRESASQTEFRNWMVFLLLFTLCLQTVRGIPIEEPFYGICYAVAGYVTGAAVSKLKEKL